MVDRIYVFLALFTFVYFLESIGGTYMITAVQNIERQFQIPSKLSGFLVSTHDISYVLTVVFVSYYGSRGNRAKWIGAGTMLLALAHILTAAPNFLFRAEVPQLNLTAVENVTIPELLAYTPIRDRISPKVRQMLLSRLERPNWTGETLSAHTHMRHNGTAKSLYAIDEPLIEEILHQADQLISGGSNSTVALVSALRHFVANREEFPEADLKTMRRAAIAPFAFCHRLVNDFRSILQNAKCAQNGSNFGPLLIIFLAMLILGLGRTVPWTLGIPLIDDNVKKHQMPMYFAMINFFKIMGPICGFLIGAAVNKLYYTFPVSAPKGLTAQDPTWIGAWWLGFLFIGVVKIGPSIMLFFFPESKKGKRRHSLANGTNPTVYIHPQTPALLNNDSPPLKNGHSAIVAPVKEKKKLALFDRHVQKEGEKEGLLAFVSSYRDVLRSKVYVGASIARVLDVIAFKGYMVFLPKYLENHYGIPQYRVHIYMAVFGVLGFAFGTASGGLIMRKLRLNGRKAALYVLLCSVVNIALFSTKTLLGCHSVVNSIGRDGVGGDFNPNFTRACNAECGCESAKLYPVCDSSGQAFYSPCHAGCRHVSDLDKYQLEFSQCECVPGSGVVSRDLCPDKCEVMKYLYFATIILGAFIGGTAVVPGMLLLLRSVPPKSRSPALGLQGLLVSAIGTLPSPIIWGWLIDSACLVWENECQKGSCQIYDPWKLRMRMHLFYVFFRSVSLIADIYVCKHAKGLNLQEDEQKSSENSDSSDNSAPLKGSEEKEKGGIPMENVYRHQDLNGNESKF